MNLLLIILLQYGMAITTSVNTTQTNTMRSVSKNGMTIKWEFENDRIVFEMSAPSTGWLAIGFNETPLLPNTYLIMGSVVRTKVSIVEHTILAVGDYRPLVDLGGKPKVKIISGEEVKGRTTLSFSLPVESTDKLTKHLQPGLTYSLLLAFSQEDDFRHHSIMRTTIKIKL